MYNTADLNKPLSTDTQNALDLKLDLAKIGLANGAASLDARENSIVPNSSTVSKLRVVDSQAAMPCQM
jgi:hypothetical protein